MESGEYVADVTVNGASARATLDPRGKFLRWTGAAGGAASGGMDIGDIIGLGSGAGNSLQLYAYPRGTQKCLGSPNRRRQIIDLAFSEEGDRATWASVIKGLLAEGRPRKLLCLVNPSGGKGQAEQVYKKEVLPVFQDAGIDVDLVVTQRRFHAQEEVSKWDFTGIDGIVCISGDAIPSEVVNGLMSRADADAVLRIPIGHIPGGSGNGLAKSLLDEVGEPCDAVGAACAIVRGQSRDIDIAELSQGQKTFYSILSLEWGLIGDLDIETEPLRWMGGFRFTVGVIRRLLGLRTYQGSLSYKPLHGGGGPDGWVTIQGPFVMVWAMNVKWAATDAKVAPAAELADGAYELMIIRETSRFKLARMFLDIESGKHARYDFVQIEKVSAFRLEPGPVVKGSPSGHLVLDGELMAAASPKTPSSSPPLLDYGSMIEISVIHGKARVFCGTGITL